MSPTDSKAAFHALSGIAQNNPLVRAAIKYWWLAIPAGMVMYYKIRKAPNKDLETILTSFGVSFGPVIPLIMLSESLAARQAATPAAAPAAAPALATDQAKEASFSVVTPTPQPFPTAS